jgi:formylglycine-generating enzyme required for sulfatase activity
MEYGRSMPIYDRRTGKRLPTHAEWEQFGRWRRWRDLLLGWEPPRDPVFPWEED